MTEYEVLVSTALPRSLAAVRKTVRLGEVPSVIREALGEVWQFLREHKIRSTGHNVAIYAPGSGSGADAVLDVWFGVEVHELIPPSDNISQIATPTGPVASAVHWGEYANLGGAYDALKQWCTTTGRRAAPQSWEVYGDWFDDWSKVRTDVFFLLEA
jgi:effector-binding domain-containing protein